MPDGLLKSAGRQQACVTSRGFRLRRRYRTIPLMIRKMAGICLLVCGVSAQAETKWIHMSSPNFEVYSGAGERDTRETIRYFEKVSSFFLQKDKHSPRKPVPVYIVIFGS